MLAVRIDMHGGTEVLRTVQVATPTPGPVQVLVRHEAIGVNFVDTQNRAGAPYPVELPLIPGIEAAGQVDGVGPGVEEIREGDRVASKGLIVAFGQSSGPVPPMDIARLSGLTGEGLPGSVWLTWPTLTDYNATRQILLGRAAAVFASVLEGTLRQPSLRRCLSPTPLVRMS